MELVYTARYTTIAELGKWHCFGPCIIIEVSDRIPQDNEQGNVKNRQNDKRFEIITVV